MLNFRMLRAWPNYFLVPAMLGFWLILGVLAAELLGAKPYSQE